MEMLPGGNSKIVDYQVGGGNSEIGEYWEAGALRKVRN